MSMLEFSPLELWGPNLFSGKARVRGAEFFLFTCLHAVFLFLYFFGGKLKEISEIEIFFSKIRSESYRDFSCKKCGKTLQGTCKTRKFNQVCQSWLSGESC